MTALALSPNPLSTPTRIPIHSDSMRLGIVACDILEKEIEFLTKDDPDFTYREYIEFALHENPPELKRVVVEKVNALKGQVDAVFLGYAICNSLENVTQEFEVPAAMLPGADCIDALLGPEEYKNEKKKCTGTWFCSPGWAMEGTNGLIKELHLDSMIEEGYDPSFFLDIIFDSYERTLFIDDGIGDADKYEAEARKFSDEIGLRTECRTCNLDRIKETIEKTKELGRSNTSES